MIEVNLLYPDKKSDNVHTYGLAGDMIKDLNLSVIMEAMANRDEYIYQSCRGILMEPILDREVLRFRQQLVNDAVQNAAFYEEIYRLAGEAVEKIEKQRGKGKEGTREMSKTQQIYRSLELLLVEISYLQKIKEHMRGEEAERCQGMLAFSMRLREVCSDEFVQMLQEEVSGLAYLLHGGRLVVSAGVGGGMKCSDVVINQLEPFDIKGKNRISQFFREIIRFFAPQIIRLKDTTLVEEAGRMETNGMHFLLEVFQKPIREFQDFFEQLKYQVSFYVGAARLHHKLTLLHMPVSFPQVCGGEERIEYQKLYELSMALTTLKLPVSNSLSDDCHLHVISGANQGGKSTFLRSVGIAQVMMQAGLFVPAAYFVSPLYDTIMTHFTRREDSSMNSGRLVEEMKRMNIMIERMSRRSMVLMNESFSSTTEKEGSQVAENVIQALFDCGVTVWMVTHLFAFADGLYQKGISGMRFMIAERNEDGSRTFHMLDGKPEQTSYGMDLYEEVVNGFLNSQKEEERLDDSSE